MRRAPRAIQTTSFKTNHFRRHTGGVARAAAHDPAAPPRPAARECTRRPRAQSVRVRRATPRRTPAIRRTGSESPRKSVYRGQRWRRYDRLCARFGHAHKCAGSGPPAARPGALGRPERGGRSRLPLPLAGWGGEKRRGRGNMEASRPLRGARGRVPPPPCPPRTRGRRTRDSVARRGIRGRDEPAPGANQETVPPPEVSS